MIEWVPRILRRRYAELDRPRLGELDERRVRAELHPKTGAIHPSVRRFIASAAGLSPDHSKGDSK